VRAVPLCWGTTGAVTAAGRGEAGAWVLDERPVATVTRHGPVPQRGGHCDQAWPCPSGWWPLWPGMALSLGSPHPSLHVGLSSRFTWHFPAASCRMCFFSCFTWLYVRKALVGPVEDRTAEGSETTETVLRSSVTPLPSRGTEARSTVRSHGVVFSPLSLQALASPNQTEKYCRWNVCCTNGQNDAMVLHMHQNPQNLFLKRADSQWYFNGLHTANMLLCILPLKIIF